MNEIIEKIRTKSAGLFYMSESDYPLVPFHWDIKQEKLESKLISEAGKPADSKIDKISIQYFFRNMVKLEDTALANRFSDLQLFLLNELTNVEVYRVGTIQVQVFIVGQLKDGSYAGLHTTSIET